MPQYDWDKVPVPIKAQASSAKRWATRDRRPGTSRACGDSASCWYFCPDEHKVTIGEGQTILKQTARSRRASGDEAPTSCTFSTKA
jgi:Pyruvate/2-oxoacid:ferredoxin oxidoreductase delta subunit